MLTRLRQRKHKIISTCQRLQNHTGQETFSEKFRFFFTEDGSSLNKLDEIHSTSFESRQGRGRVWSRKAFVSPCPHRPALGCLRPQNSMGCSGAEQANLLELCKKRSSSVTSTLNCTPDRQLQGLHQAAPVPLRGVCWGAGRSNTGRSQAARTSEVQGGSRGPNPVCDTASVLGAPGHGVRSDKEEVWESESPFLGSYSSGNLDLRFTPTITTA